MSVVMGFVVISDNYFMYKDRIFIIKNIDYFNIKDRNLLTIAFKDKHKYIVRVKKRLAADINTCLSILANNEG
jgi:Mg2+ and Co2+ transporter CorA